MRYARSRLYRFIRDESAGILIFVALSVPVVISLLALNIDIGMTRVAANRLQIAADAAAMAGVSQLPDNADARAEALLYSEKNHPDIGSNAVMTSADVTLGRWEDGAFSPGGTPRNAVRVVAHRSAAMNTPILPAFGQALGVTSYDVTRSATAFRDTLYGCQTGGIFTKDEVISGSNNDYAGDFCLYGKKGVKISSDNNFEPGTIVAMSDLDDFQEGGNNTGVDDALREDTVPLILPGMVTGIIADMEAGNLAAMPSYISAGPINLDEITDTTPLSPNTLYIVDDVADFGSNRVLSNVAVVATKEVKVGSNVTLSNVVFATRDKLLIGSYNTVGTAGYCATGKFNVYLFANDNVEFGSNNDLRGVQIGGKSELKLGSDIGALDGVHAEVTGKVDYGSADSYTGCTGGLTSDFGATELPLGLGAIALVQ